MLTVLGESLARSTMCSSTTFYSSRRRLHLAKPAGAGCPRRASKKLRSRLKSFIEKVQSLQPNSGSYVPNYTQLRPVIVPRSTPYRADSPCQHARAGLHETIRQRVRVRNDGW
jgi:hypothetical protein